MVHWCGDWCRKETFLAQSVAWRCHCHRLRCFSHPWRQRSPLRCRKEGLPLANCQNERSNPCLASHSRFPLLGGKNRGAALVACRQENQWSHRNNIWGINGTDFNKQVLTTSGKCYCYGGYGEVIAYCVFFISRSVSPPHLVANDIIVVSNVWYVSYH